MAVSRSLRFQILRRDNHTCRYCGRSAPEVKLTVDHVIPEALGGRDEPENLVTACAPCNSGKAASPPDASHVAQVAEDALRWAEAMREAARQRQAVRDARRRFVAEFEEAWNVWRYGPENDRQTVPLPDDFDRSLEVFFEHGLPLDVVQHAIRVAMRNQKVRADQTWRYFCGICWRELDDMRRAASDHLNAAAAPPGDSSGPQLAPHERDAIEIPAHDRGRRELAEEMLDLFAQDQAQEYRRVAREQALEEGDELSDADNEGAYLLGRAALVALQDRVDSAARLEMAVERVMEKLPGDVRSYLMNRSEEDVRANQGSDYTAFDVQVWAIFLLAFEIEAGSLSWTRQPPPAHVDDLTETE